MNAISAAGIGALVGGYGMLGIAGIALLIGLIKRTHHVSNIEQIRLRETQYYLNKVFSALKASQIAVISHGPSQSVDIYTQSSRQTYFAQTAESTVSEWRNEDPSSRQGYSVIGQEELANCIKEKTGELKKM